ncbi:MAG: right-handed parallel beta-helix repeat-containing protein, partial [Planctomycetota bacterium]
MRKNTAFLFVCLLMSASCLADTIIVDDDGPNDFNSIQAAIDGASNGDTIIVNQGTYSESLNMSGKAITLQSTDPNNPAVVAATVIDGTGYYHVVQCKSGEDANTILTGFTITGGNANGTGYNSCGGGMYNYLSNPTVTNCTFTGNRADSGGGMFNHTSSPTVKNCIFKENSTHEGLEGLDGLDADFFSLPYDGEHGGDGGDGAGMYNVNASPVVINCTFIENSTGDGGKGGDGGEGYLFNDGADGGDGGKGGKGAGMYNENSSPQLVSCIFKANLTGFGGKNGSYGDAGWYSDDGSYGNSGDGGNGAGIYNCENSAPILSDCTFIKNSTGSGGPGGRSYGLTGKGGDGAGIYNDNSSPNLTNCSFEINETGGGGNGGKPGNGGNGAGMYNCNNSNPAITNCLFTGNRTGNGGEGNIARSSDFGPAGGDGAGIYNDDSSPNLTDCRFTANITGNGGNGEEGTGYDDGDPGGRGGHGGGMFNTNDSYPTITNCTFSKNMTGYGGNGGQGAGSSGFMLVGQITGGDGGNGGNGGSGAGIYNDNYSGPNIIDCTFTSNRTGLGGTAGRGGAGWWSGSSGKMGKPGNGAGILNQIHSSPDLTDCRFNQNTTIGVGGGIYNLNSSQTVTNCTFFSNSSLVGGGMSNSGNSLMVTNCTFISNQSELGGGMYNSGNGLIVTNCTFISNVSFWMGGGMFNSGSSPIVTNCTFTSNKSFWRGGGMYNSRTSSTTVTNCILWDDEAFFGGKEIYGTASVDYSCIEGGYTGSGNINTDPLFTDMDGRLLETSPCVDAGDNSAPHLPERDLDDNPRIIDSYVDMGAYEFTSLPVRNVTRSVFYETIQSAIDDANDFDQIRVPPGVYAEAVDFKGKAVHLYSSGGPEVTTIDGTGHDHVVKCISGEDANTILYGFTITGGDANGPDPNDYCGGGMFNDNSNPTVTDCIFTGNSADKYGGGMYNLDSSPTVTNSTFSSNAATEKGGAIANYSNSDPYIKNCIFENNSATIYGGGVYNFDSKPVMTNCIFNGNVAQLGKGGGIANYDGSNVIITNCTFYQNSADIDIGGAIRNYNCSPAITNCILWDNVPDEISSQSSSLVVSFC